MFYVMILYIYIYNLKFQKVISMMIHMSHIFEYYLKNFDKNNKNI